VISTYVGKKPIMTIQQARKLAGLPPATPDELEEIQTMGAAPTGAGSERRRREMTRATPSQRRSWRSDAGGPFGRSSETRSSNPVLEKRSSEWWRRS
jgi:hypothetical protein